MKLTLGKIAEWTHGKIDERDASVEITGVSTDSRSAKEGDLFVPLVGFRFDGHDFITSAMQRCAATLSDRPLEEKVPVVQVENTERAYGDIARGYRQSLNLHVVGVTGSVGKTTTKEMIASVMEQKYSTVKTEGNHNNQIGLPRTVLDIGEDCQVAVLEMGMNHFGEMSYLTSIAHPDLAVITNIGSAHIEHLGSREGILKAKLEITEGLSRRGTLLLNGDEPLLWNLRGTLPFKTIYFGIKNPECDLCAKNIVSHDEGMSFHVEGLREEFEVYLPAPGLHNVYNALAAAAVGLLGSVEPSKIQRALGNFHNTGMRQKIYQKDGFTIIEDCYNAGPESTEAALDILAGFRARAKGRCIAVLGDMLELGNRSAAEHYRIGRIAAAKVDMLYTYGTNSERMVSGAITGGMKQKFVEHFDTHEDLAHMLKMRARPGDVILFKGSRGMRMEKALSLFLKEEKS